jgi:hypothetical protein
MSSSPFIPKSNFAEVPQIVADQLNIKSLVLYPNIDASASQYIQLKSDSKESLQQPLVKIKFEEYPENLELKDISLNLEHGMVVSKTFIDNSAANETKQTLLENNMGKHIEFEFINDKDNTVARRAGGEFLGKYNNKYYIKEKGSFKTTVVREINNPSNVVYTCTDNAVKNIELFNPTDQPKSHMELTVATDQLNQRGLLNYRIPKIKWDMHCDLILDDSTMTIPEIIVVAEVFNGSKYALCKIENLKFVICKIDSYRVKYSNGSSGTRTSYSFIGGGCTNTICGGVSNDYIPTTSEYTVDDINSRIESPKKIPQDLKYNGSQKHISGVGTLMINDVQSLTSNQSTSLLIYRNQDVPFKYMFTYDLENGKNTPNKYITISKEDNPKVARFMPASTIHVKSKHPDGTIVEVGEIKNAHTFTEKGLNINIGISSEIRITKTSTSVIEYKTYDIQSTGGLYKNVIMHVHKKHWYKETETHVLTIENNSINDCIIDVAYKTEGVDTILPIAIKTGKKTETIITTVDINPEHDELIEYDEKHDEKHDDEESE